MGVSARLVELGLILPAAQPPVATYVPFVRSGALVFVSGQLPMQNGKLAREGTMPGACSIEEAQEAAKIALLNVLAHLATACEGNLDRVRRVVRLGGFIAADASFRDHARVMNGASDLAVALFGEAGRHARATVGVASLPLGATVEVEGHFEVE